MSNRRERLGDPLAVLDMETVRVPAGVHALEPFRAWARSAAFPERGRIDFLAGDVDVDMSPEDLYTHGAVKAEIAAVLHALVVRQDRGHVFVDRARVSSPEGDLSVEPDVVVLLWESLETERVRHIPAASGKEGRYIELEGAPDLVVEVVSDGSQAKDRRRLPPLYARAGVRELWQVDVRGAEPQLAISTLAAPGYQRMPADGDGWVPSPVLGLRFRLDRQTGRHGTFRFRLEHEARPGTRGGSRAERSGVC
jgi:Uma2 family endonuclease